MGPCDPNTSLKPKAKNPHHPHPVRPLQPLPAPAIQLRIVNIGVNFPRRLTTIDDGYHIGCDFALKALSQAAHQNLDNYSNCHAVFARSGGEQFMVLLPQVTLRQTVEFAERLGIKMEEVAVKAFFGTFNVTLDFSRPGKPTDNGFIEAFNSKLRSECLNVHWFLTRADSREKLETWRRYYNEERPHSAIGYNVPIALHNPGGATSQPS